MVRPGRGTPALHSRRLDVVHAHDGNRVIAFTRRQGTFDVLVVASPNGSTFPDGYRLDAGPARIRPGAWREVLERDPAFYGGADVRNLGAAVGSTDGRIDVRLPANGLRVRPGRPSGVPGPARGFSRGSPWAPAPVSAWASW